MQKCYISVYVYSLKVFIEDYSLAYKILLPFAT